VISCDTRNFKVIFGYYSKIKKDGDIRDREDEKKKIESRIVFGNDVQDNMIVYVSYLVIVDKK
jgi:hypothetical protein